MFVFEWYHAIILVLVTFLFADWYAKKQFKEGYHRGIRFGSRTILSLLLTQKFIKYVDPNAKDPIFQRWEELDNEDDLRIQARLQEAYDLQDHQRQAG